MKGRRRKEGRRKEEAKEAHIITAGHAIIKFVALRSGLDKTLYTVTIDHFLPCNNHTLFSMKRK